MRAALCLLSGLGPSFVGGVRLGNEGVAAVQPVRSIDFEYFDQPEAADVPVKLPRRSCAFRNLTDLPVLKPVYELILRKADEDNGYTCQALATFAAKHKSRLRGERLLQAVGGTLSLATVKRGADVFRRGFDAEAYAAQMIPDVSVTTAFVSAHSIVNRKSTKDTILREMQELLEGSLTASPDHQVHMAAQARNFGRSLLTLFGGSALIYLSGTALPVLAVHGADVYNGVRGAMDGAKAVQLRNGDLADLSDFWCHVEKKCSTQLPEVFPIIDNTLAHRAWLAWREIRAKLSPFNCTQYLSSSDSCSWTCAWRCQTEKPSTSQCGKQRACGPAVLRTYLPEKFGYRDESWECCCLQGGYRQATEPHELISCDESDLGNPAAPRSRL